MRLSITIKAKIMLLRIRAFFDSFDLVCRSYLSVVPDFDTILKLTFISLKWPYHAYVLIEPIIHNKFSFYKDL